MTKTSRNAEQDYELVKRALRGDEEAFVELNRELMPRILYVARSIVHDLQEAEDISQETLIKVHRKLHTFQKGYLYAPWVVKITKNVAIDHIRKNRRQPALNSLSTVADIDIFEYGLFKVYERDHPRKRLILAERYHELERAISELSESESLAITLRYQQDLSIKTIGKLCRLSETAVTSRIYRGIKNLKKSINF